MMILFLAKTVVNITVDMFKINKNYIYICTHVYIYICFTFLDWSTHSCKHLLGTWAVKCVDLTYTDIAYMTCQDSR